MGTRTPVEGALPATLLFGGDVLYEAPIKVGTPVDELLTRRVLETKERWLVERTFVSPSEGG